MKKIFPFIVLFLFVAMLVALEEGERAGWHIDLSWLKEKISQDEIAVEKNVPFVKTIHFGNDPQRPIKYKYTLMVNEEGKTIKHGESLRYTENGQLASRMFHVDGNREGNCLIYHTNGQIWKEQPYVHGKLSGLCKRYDRHGQLSATYEYKQGMPGMGLIEYTNLGKIRPQPLLRIKKLDRIKSANKYILQFSIEGENANRYKNVVYYVGELIEGKYFHANMMKAGTLKGKMGELEIDVPKGYIVNETFNIVAVGKNSEGLSMIWQKKVEVGVRGV